MTLRVMKQTEYCITEVLKRFWICTCDDKNGYSIKRYDIKWELL